MQNIGKNIQKHTAGGVSILALLALLIGSATQPAAAQQGVTPTPQPAANVSGLKAERAQTQARLDEINRNIEAQIVEAERAASAAREAAATKNAVEFGAAIGRLEGALAQLRASYAGKDAIISDLQTRLEQQAAQSAVDRRTIDKLISDLQQAQRDKQAANAAYNAALTERKTSETNDMVNGAVKLIVALAFLLAVIAFGLFVVQRRRAVVIETPPAGDIINAEIVDTVL